MKKRLLVLPLLIIVVLSWYTLTKLKQNGNHQSNKVPKYKMEASRLFKEFQLVEATANARYKNQLIEVRGKVKDVKSDVDGKVTVDMHSGSEMFAVTCQLATCELPFVEEIQKGEELTLRGTCKGILMDVLLEDCKIE